LGWRGKRSWERMFYTNTRSPVNLSETSAVLGERDERAAPARRADRARRSQRSHDRPARKAPVLDDVERLAEPGRAGSTRGRRILRALPKQRALVLRMAR